jgi:hypothetical protein
MEFSHALSLIALGFALFGVVLLIVPVWLLTTKARMWREVVGLWIAGWGFLLIAVGSYFAPRGFGGLVGLGVLVAVAGHVIQGRATRAERPSSLVP